jgi:hypothetical protein
MAVITWLLNAVEGSDTFDPHAKHAAMQCLTCQTHVSYRVNYTYSVEHNIRFILIAL